MLYTKRITGPAIQSTFFPAWLHKSAGLVFPVCLLALGMLTLTDYLQSSFTTLMVGYAALAATVTKKQAIKPYRYAIAAVVMLTLTWLVPVKTLLYLAFACVLFFWIESQRASVHLLGAAALFISSPAFQYAAGVFSFPIRLQLTKIIGTVFSLFATGIELKGNVIFYKGHEFAVDPACMGLHMLSLSLLLGILLAGLLQRKSGRVLTLKTALFYLACLFMLNLLSNVLRIILLVQFAVPPEATMHDVIGLLCLLLYVAVPACFLTRYFISRSPAVKSTADMKKPQKAAIVHWLLFGALAVIAVRIVTIDTYSPFQKKYQQRINGYTSSVYAPGILKLENNRSLVYVKFIRGFYDTEHNPMFCWKGSGYELHNIQTQTIAGANVYTAILQRQEEKLYTAWWYGNAHHQTTSQWEWRWRMLKGETGYSVQNVTSDNAETLRKEVGEMLSSGSLLPLLGQ